MPSLPARPLFGAAFGRAEYAQSPFGGGGGLLVGAVGVFDRLSIEQL
jgi:hypothetical protein